ncbi:MAG: RecQ family ATP-dependent DNA helicase [Clostridia bacterium]|nr:RecQ family ATP-dependent DNA helicase [Clostridia bacterium]
MDKYSVLKQVFGHDRFREGQEGLIDQLLAGYDVLGIMPTGAGKSVCYQIPALMMQGITLVVSPLISLMKDQVMALKAAGVAAAYINSSLTPGQQAEAIRRATNGAYKIIYVAPERLEMPAFIRFAQQSDIALFAVDEAHCVSQWGHDFRPSYLRIADFVKKLPKRPPIAAFTATATKQVRQDIIELLELQEPYCLSTGFNRPNLRFSSIKPTDKFQMLLAFLRDYSDSCGIVYCNTRKTVEDVTIRLLDEGYRATRYHAGLSDTERRENQEAFQFDRVQIMVATNAFGMGIDKSNVRFVVHYNMPRNLESYYQEAGRAGRDGQPAECLLLYSGQDVITGKWMIEHSEENAELTTQQREEVMKLELEKLKQMTYFATSSSCLRKNLLRYFGEQEIPDRCEYCSVCQDEPFEVDTGRSRRARLTGDPIRQPVRSSRRGRVYSDAEHFSVRERALFDNLKMLRQLIASEKSIPAYTVFSDAALADMVRRQPATMEQFLDVSGVGLAKQEQYGKVFLSVIRDGCEPNDAMLDFQIVERTKLTKENRGSVWSDEEENQLQNEFDSEIPLREIAKRHQRSTGAIKARLRKMELID